ncbi:MAG: TonB-dependent receptor [Halieaceae bacterium]|nr:TonB-dependent receptor [Halieaceae bacterium]
MDIKFWTKIHVLCALAIGLQAFPALSTQLEEVIVTAQKREQSMQDVPFSVSALSGSALQNRGVSDIMDLQSISPSIMTPSTGSPGEGASFRIRGFGSPPFQMGIEPAVALFIDDVYRSRSGVAVGDLVDVSRIEILKGPQGTLFGKNTTAGVIHIVTNEPKTEAFEGFVEGSYEKYDRTRLKGMVNIPLSDTSALRISGIWGDGDGYFEPAPGTEKSNDLNRNSINAQALFNPNDDLSIKLAVSSSNIDEICCAPVVYDELDDLIGHDSFDAIFDASDLMYSATINWSINEKLTLTSISAYQDYEMETTVDGDFIEAPILTIDTEIELSAFTQEIRLTGETDILTWTIGAFYSDEEIDRLRSFIWGPVIEFTPLGGFLDPGLGVTDDLYQNGESWAIFGQASFSISDTMTLTTGLRFNNEEKDGGGDLYQFQFGPPGVVNPFFRATIDESDTTGVVSLQNDFSDSVMGYFTYQHGYKAGGINLAREAAGNIGQPGEPTFESEGAKNLELGIKSEIMDGALRVNAAYFKTEYDDLQNQTLVGQSFIVRNGKGAEINGFELEGLLALTDNFSVNFGALFLDTEFEEGTDLGTGNIGGSDLPFAPDSSIAIGWEYFTPLSQSSLELFTNGNFLSKSSYMAGTDGNPLETQGSHKILNAQVGIRSEDWSAMLWCRNCTDEIVAEIRFNNPLLGVPLAFPNRPREFGVTVRYNF